MQRDGEADSVVLSGGTSWDLANVKIPEPMFGLLSQSPKLIINAFRDQTFLVASLSLLLIK